MSDYFKIFLQRSGKVCGAALLTAFAVASCSQLPVLKTDGDVRRFYGLSAVPEERQLTSDYRLLTSDGRSHLLLQQAGAEFVAVSVVQSAQWPLDKITIQKIRDLQKRLGRTPQIELRLLSLNPDEKRERLQTIEQQADLEFPVLIDGSQLLALELGVRNNLDTVVVRVRDRRIVGQQSADTEQAVKWAEDFSSEQLPDYSREIAPLLVKTCTNCHREGGTAPWAMKNHEMILRWKKMIREVAVKRRMPPAQSDHYYHDFIDEPRLTDAEMRKLVRWIDGGAPRGKGQDPLLKVKPLPRRDFVLGKPDVVLEFPSQTMPAEGPDIILSHKVEWPFDREVRIRGMEVQTDNPEATHHLTVYYLIPTEDPAKPVVVQFDAGYLPGYEPHLLPYGLSYTIPPRSPVRISPHFVTTGKPETINGRIGYYIDKSPPGSPVYDLVYCGAQTRVIDIPPHTPRYVKITRAVITEDLWAMVFATHMHDRGVSTVFSARLPGKSEEKVLLSIPVYDRKWQREYMPAEPVFLPKGTEVVCEGVFDNSAGNPRITTPQNAVSYGWSADQEMLMCGCIGMRDADYQKYLGKKTAAPPVDLKSNRILAQPLNE